MTEEPSPTGGGRGEEPEDGTPGDGGAVEERRVRRTAKTEDGDIVALCNPYAHWQRVTKWQAMREIEERRFRYYVEREDGVKVYVEVEGDRLRTEGDVALDRLPDC